MTDEKSRYIVDIDLKNDVITVTDELEELKTEFDSEIILAPVDDALVVINELNKKEAIINMLKEQLLSFVDEEDVEYWIKEAAEDLE